MRLSAGSGLKGIKTDTKPAEGSAEFQWDDIAGKAIDITIAVKAGNGTKYAQKTVTGITVAGRYDIYSWYDLQKMNGDLAGDYTVKTDITFPAPGEYAFPVKGFLPIGGDTVKSADYYVYRLISREGFNGTAFSGILNGGDHTITGLYINDPDLDYVGLFGKINAGNSSTIVVKDLTLIDPIIKANAMAGALVGYLPQGRSPRSESGSHIRQ